jgi:hypothetical protein
MKKLIGLFAILMLSMSVFGQKYIRNASSIERTQTGNNTIADAINRTNFDNGDYSWIQDVHFIKEGKLYLLAYEPKADALLGGERRIYLYSIDTLNIKKNSWKIASYVVMINYISADSKEYRDVDLHTKNFNGSYGNVSYEQDLSVKITFGVEMNDERPVAKTLTFISQGNGFYKVK